MEVEVEVEVEVGFARRRIALRSLPAVTMEKVFRSCYDARGK